MSYHFKNPSSEIELNRMLIGHGNDSIISSFLLGIIWFDFKLESKVVSIKTKINNVL